MENTIQTIIESKIPKGHIFDAHTIIEYLIQYDSDIYLSSYQNNWTTDFYHSEISKLIATFEGALVSCQLDIVVYILYLCQQKSHDKIQGHFNKRRA